jgi:SAM-dependent methyltransferase
MRDDRAIEASRPNVAAGTRYYGGNLRELRELFNREVPNVSEVVHTADGMYRSHGAYFKAGQSAVRGIRLAMLASRTSEVGRILDLPSGYGRVLRTLTAAFPEAEVTACDIDRDAVDFCAQALGATPLYSSEDPLQIEAKGRYDLIWCGSLQTHLPSGRWGEFLEFFRSVLSPGGLLVFTVAGDYVARRLTKREHTYGLPEESIDGLVGDYSAKGFGYRNYDWSEDYGISLSSPVGVLTQLARISEWRLISYWERGWNDHQDLIATLRERS